MPEEESTTETVSSQFATNKYIETIGLATTISTVRAPGHADLPTDLIDRETDIIALAQHDGIMIQAPVSAIVSAGGLTVFSLIDHIHPELTSVYNSVSTTSADWNNSFTNVSTTSADWNLVVTNVSNTSGDWNNTYTNVSTTSGDWNTSYNAFTTISNASADWNTAATNVNEGTVEVNLTTAQIETLKGDPGESLTFDDLTAAQKLELKGDPGVNGTTPVFTYDATTKILTITNA